MAHDKVPKSSKEAKSVFQRFSWDPSTSVPSLWHDEKVNQSRRDKLLKQSMNRNDNRDNSMRHQIQLSTPPATEFMLWTKWSPSSFHFSKAHSELPASEKNSAIFRDYEHIVRTMMVLKWALMTRARKKSSETTFWVLKGQVTTHLFLLHKNVLPCFTGFFSVSKRSKVRADELCLVTNVACGHFPHSWVLFQASGSLFSAWLFGRFPSA